MAGRRRRARLGRTATAAAIAAAAGCAGRLDEGPPGPPARRDALVAEHSTRPGHPVRLLFRWSAREPDFRGRGSGVARVEPPYRARLDLFLDNGEAVVVAAVVGDEVRAPGSLPRELVPPPALFWAALGVFRPGDDASYVRGARSEGAVTLEYRLAPGRHVRYRLRDGLIAGVARLQEGRTVEQVEVGPPAAEAASFFPSQAVYRHFPGFRELRLELESLEWADSFPPDIWTFHDR